MKKQPKTVVSILWTPAALINQIVITSRQYVKFGVEWVKFGVEVFGKIQEFYFYDRVGILEREKRLPKLLVSSLRI